MSKKKPDYIWRVTKDDQGGIDVAFGPKLTGAPFDDDAKLNILGRALIQLGTQLMGSTVNASSDDEDDDE